MRILVVEDDRAIIESLGALLRDEGYEVVTVTGQHDAIAQLTDKTFDLVLLDITLADGNGFAVCTAARKISPELPIIFLTASDDEYSTVAGLDMGAVDYIAKPFRARELLSRIRVATRHHEAGISPLSAYDVVLDPTAARVTKAGREVSLSALEYRLLLYFLQHKGKLVTRENLRDTIWESAGEYVSDNAVNVYIKRLREKVEDDPAQPTIICTVRGLGYKVGG